MRQYVHHTAWAIVGFLLFSGCETEELKQPQIAAQREFEEAEAAAILARRRATLDGLQKVEKTKATQALYAALQRFKEANDRIMISLEGEEPAPGVSSALSDQLAAHLRSRVGVRVGSAANNNVKTKLHIRWFEDVREVPVTVTIGNSKTVTERVREHRFCPGMQKREYQWVDKPIESTLSRNAEASYPVLRAQVRFSDSDPWEITSDGVWDKTHWHRIEEGTHVADTSYDYSAKNLADRIAFAMLGPLFVD